MDRRGAFDYILLETTGLADPGNIAPLFWVDEGLGSTIYLDGIVTIVDAKNLLRSLEEPVGEEVAHEVSGGVIDERNGHGHAEKGMGDGKHLSIAHLQISHADVVVINKADLVSPAQLQAVESRVRSINALAQVKITDHSRVPELEGLVLDLHAYDHVSAESLEFASKGHSHLDPAIGTVTLQLSEIGGLDESAFGRLDEWLRTLLWEEKVPGEVGVGVEAGWEIHRIKGRVLVAGGKVKMLQGVREIFEFIDAADGPDAGGPETDTGGKIVLIGRNIAALADILQRSLDASLKLQWFSGSSNWSCS